MQYSTYKIQYLIEMTQYFIAWSNRWFFVVKRRTKKLWVRIFDVSDDWHSTVFIMWTNVFMTQYLHKTQRQAHNGEVVSVEACYLMLWSAVLFFFFTDNLNQNFTTDLIFARLILLFESQKLWSSTIMRFIDIPLLSHIHQMQILYFYFFSPTPFFPPPSFQE